MIDGPYYINLDLRTDRKELIEKEFDTLGIKNAERVSAVYNEKGALGCLQSHVKVLEKSDALDQSAATWVCEDDIQVLVDRPTLDKYIKEFMDSNADILCLGNSSWKDVYYSTNLRWSFDLQTTSSYIVKPRLRSKLIELWKSVLHHSQMNAEHPLKGDFMRLNIIKGDFEAPDQCWKLLQQQYMFVIPNARCIIQRDGYSDIEKRVVSYSV